MSDTLDVIVLDDDEAVCEVITDLIKDYYTWGQVYAFTDVDKAIKFCMNRDFGVAIFVVDVYLSGKNAFSFLDAIADKFPMAFEDTIIITGNASADIVNIFKFPMAFEDTIIITGNASADIVNICLASDINYLLEKPVRPYALQLAVWAIVSKYLHFVKKLHMNPALMESLSKFQT